jgi:peptidoglycan/LPS O-acetylase OafA/YrhL
MLTRKKEDYKYYLAGLKGLACILIMTSHFFGIYNYAESFPSIHILDVILDSRLSFLISADFWLYLFFAVSGYLVAQSKIERLRDIVLKIVNRFFRLALPILFVYIIVYIIYLLHGFHASDTVSLFDCEWYQKYYTGQYSLLDVVLGPVNVLLRGKPDLNNPYWVLRDMFISSVLIYILRYCYHRLSKKKADAICFSALLLITFGSYFFSYIITACLMGMIVAFYEKKAISDKPYFAFWAMIVFLSVYLLPDKLVSALFFCSLIVYIPGVKWIERLLSSKPFIFIGDISWGVYSLHWPLLCSVGAVCIIKLSGVTGLTAAFLLSFLIIVISTLLLSTAFFFTFEKLSGFLTRKIVEVFKSALYMNEQQSEK